MSKLADEIEIADALQVIAQAERYLRYMRGEGEYAPKPEPKKPWLDRVFPIYLPKMPSIVPYCPSRERVEWAEKILQKLKQDATA